jgi:hypothetical protein
MQPPYIIISIVLGALYFCDKYNQLFKYTLISVQNDRNGVHDVIFNRNGVSVCSGSNPSLQ